MDSSSSVPIYQTIKTTYELFELRHRCKTQFFNNAKLSPLQESELNNKVAALIGAKDWDTAYQHIKSSPPERSKPTDERHAGINDKDSLLIASQKKEVVRRALEQIGMLYTNEHGSSIELSYEVDHYDVDHSDIRRIGAYITYDAFTDLITCNSYIRCDLNGARYNNIELSPCNDTKNNKSKLYDRIRYDISDLSSKGIVEKVSDSCLLINAYLTQINKLTKSKEHESLFKAITEGVGYNPDKVIQHSSISITFSAGWKLTLSPTGWVITSSAFRDQRLLWDYIAREAGSGSKIHIRVLEFLKAYNNKDFLKFYSLPVLEIGRYKVINEFVNKELADRNGNSIYSCNIKIDDSAGGGSEFLSKDAVIYCVTASWKLKYTLTEFELNRPGRHRLKVEVDEEAYKQLESALSRNMNINGSLIRETLNHEPSISKDGYQQFNQALARLELELGGFHCTKDTHDCLEVELEASCTDSGRVLGVTVRYDAVKNGFSATTYCRREKAVSDRIPLTYDLYINMFDGGQYDNLGYTFRDLHNLELLVKTRASLENAISNIHHHW